MKKLVIVLTSISVIFIIGLLIYFSYFRNSYVRSNDKKDIVNIIPKEVEEIDENEPITENIIEDDQDDNVIIQNDDNNDSNSNKNNMESNSVSNSDVINKSKIVEEQGTVSQEIKETEQTTTTKVEEPTIEEVRDDIVDTNSFFYSIHQGKIEMSSQNNCLSAGSEIAFIDTVDINYYRCYEVTSTTGKILGYYLNIFCESGNCNRYKSQIDMSNYR